MCLATALSNSAQKQTLTDNDELLVQFFTGLNRVFTENFLSPAYFRFVTLRMPPTFESTNRIIKPN